jgi:hypothetical protein
MTHPDLLRLARQLQDLPENQPVTLVWPARRGSPTLALLTDPAAPGERIVYATPADALAAAWAVLQGGYARAYRSYHAVPSASAPARSRATPDSAGHPAAVPAADGGQ